MLTNDDVEMAHACDIVVATLPDGTDEVVKGVEVLEACVEVGRTIHARLGYVTVASAQEADQLRQHLAASALLRLH